MTLSNYRLAHARDFFSAENKKNENFTNFDIFIFVQNRLCVSTTYVLSKNIENIKLFSNEKFHFLQLKKKMYISPLGMLLQ